MEAQRPPVSTPPRLLRSRDDRVVAGVCGGLAEYTGIDPVVFRIVVAVATLAGGTGLLAYVIAWISIPERRDDGSAPPPRPVARPDHAVAIVLGVLGVLLLVRVLDHGRGPFGGDGGLLLVLLVGVGVWWWVRQDRDRRVIDERADAGDLPPPVWTAPAAADDDLFGDDDPLAPAARPSTAPPRSRLPKVGLSLLLLLWGGLVLADLGGAAVDVQVAVGASLAVLGALVVVGAWFGRPGGLVALGVVLALLGGFLSVVDAPLRGGIGERSWTVAEVADLAPAYRLGVGEAVLDLRDVELDRSRTVRASVWTGQLHVIVPDDVGVEVAGRVGLGQLSILGHEESGAGIDASRREVTGEGPVLRLQLRVGIGQLEVRRGAA